MTDSHSPLVPPPGGGQQDALPGLEATALPPERQLTWTKGLIGFVVAIVATFFLAAIAGVGVAAAGGDLDDRGFIFVGTLIQDAALIAAAVFITADYGRVSARTFGLRPFGRSAFKWLVAAFFAYYALAIVYALIFSPPRS
jgi:hypothetical protein